MLNNEFRAESRGVWETGGMLLGIVKQGEKKITFKHKVGFRFFFLFFWVLNFVLELRTRRFVGSGAFWVLGCLGKAVN